MINHSEVALCATGQAELDLLQRSQLVLTGLLQGIGFRPYLYRLAHQHQLTGWVANADDGVLLEIQGTAQQHAAFLQALQANVPACGQITHLQQFSIPIEQEQGFALRASRTRQSSAVFACPDLAMCKECLTELFDRTNRRYLHPFISCCHCGPRYSVLSALPYDRPQTTLRAFPLCTRCRLEYENPLDRRFYAQTIACPDCGPRLSFANAHGVIIEQHAPLTAAITALMAGQIIAVKGIGGFQLVLEAENSAAVARLRQLKQRASKPFAVMIADLAQAEMLAELSDLEKHCLTSSAAPIVLVKAKPSHLLNNVAPQQTLLGLMLPNSPIQHLLLNALNKPLIVTSGNRQSEPICITNEQAFTELAGLADGFLVHDRDILRPLDDSIVRVIAKQATVLRRARGYVPTPVHLPHALPATLALGGQLKNTVALTTGQHVILSQHLGDLQSLATLKQQQQTIADLQQFYGVSPEQVLCDQHTDYLSSQSATQLNLNTHTVTHHYAHVLSCMAEQGLAPPVLGVAWDGIGLGLNNELWGGEFLHITQHTWQRIAHCRPFPLIGGTMAIKEPRRVALALLYEVFGDDILSTQFAPFLTAFNPTELKLLHGVLKKRINCPMTSSIGRLFDGFASLLGLCQVNEFEGQAAMALESLASHKTMTVNPEPVLNWQPLIEKLCTGQHTAEDLASELHHTLVAWLFAVAKTTRLKDLVLSGGCFQNAYLVACIVQHPAATHYRIHRHLNIPPNDGGLALGQVYAQLLTNS